MKTDGITAGLLGRLQPRYWNGIARAEMRLSYGWPTVTVHVLILLLMYAGVALVFVHSKDFPDATMGLRAILCANWIVCIAMGSGPQSRMFSRDFRIGVTDQWLMMPGDRRGMLAARAYGRIGPLCVHLFLTAPIYLIAAAGMRPGQYSLFVVGHFGRVISAFPGDHEPINFSLIGALPVALLALLCDFSVGIIGAGGGLMGALRAIMRKRAFRRFGKTLSDSLELSFRSLLISIPLVLMEAAVCLASHMWSLLCSKVAGMWLLPVSLSGALLIAAALFVVRIKLARAAVSVVAAMHDKVLLDEFI